MHLQPHTVIIRLPGSDPGTTPALFEVAGVPVLTRLILGASKAGFEHFFVVGPTSTDLKDKLGGDFRFANLDIVWLSSLTEDASKRENATVEVEANVVVGNPVWELFRKSPHPRHAPGAPLFTHKPGESTTALWDEEPEGAFVVPVVRRPDVRQAKRAIFRNVTKKTSGPISRNINSLISIPISKLLSETPITPNQMTIFTTVIGLVSAFFFAGGTFVSLAIGGTLFQLCAAFDRVDGELARSKFMASEEGAWIDTIGDNIVYVALMVCLTIGYHRFATDSKLDWSAYVIPLGTAIGTLTVFLIVSMALFLKRTGKGGTMTAISQEFEQQIDPESAGWLYRALDAMKVLGKRDSFSFIIFVISIIPLLSQSHFFYDFLFFSVAVGILVTNIYFMLSKRKLAT